MRITVVGTGYVGLVSGACLSEMGNDVICHDVDTKKVEALKQGVLPIYEPQLRDIVARNAARLTFTDDFSKALDGCAVCFIAVGTPSGADGAADIGQVLKVGRAIGELAQEPLLVVIKSTVPVGTAAALESAVNSALRQRGKRFACEVASNPEFLKEGAAVADFMRPDRVLIGVRTPAAETLMRQLYAPFLRNGHPLVVTDVRSAEMTKYAANAMLAARISMINEIAGLCDALGADVMAVRQGVGLDVRIGSQFLYPGIGYGGSCLPKDVRALTSMGRKAGCKTPLLSAVDEVNTAQKAWLFSRVVKHFDGDLAGRRIGLWGLSYKPETDDIREAPSLAFIDAVTKAGAHVACFDPQAMPRTRAHFAKNASVSFCDAMYEVAQEADALAIATEWGCFRSPDFGRLKSAMKRPLVFDGRNLYAPQAMRDAGFEYACIGRPPA